MFEKYLNKKLISDNLCAVEIFHNISDRKYWEMIKSAYKSKMEEAKKKYDSYTFEPLYASLYREFVTKKNRANFEEKYYDRRNALILYSCLEAFYNNGEYIEKIADLVWMILEETEWALPAHINVMEQSDSLPYYKDSCLDLFASETACTLSFVYTVLKDKLDEISVNISKRIEETVYERIILNYLKHDDYWWMGIYGQTPNNWNPWINSNVLVSVLTFGKDKKIKTDVIYKVMFTLDNYLNNYPDDGACDEGPSYWFRAGICALECFDLIALASSGEINVLHNEKTVNISEYILKAYIYKNRVVNFADAPSLLKIEQGTLYKFGELLNNQKLISLAKYAFDIKQEEIEVENRFLSPRRLLYFGEAYNNLCNLNIEYSCIKEAYLKSIDFLTVRENEVGEKGLYLAAKGGHNYESHNHNDVGNFIVYKDGEPFLADSGNMVYSALTFNPETRYTLWTNISEYHNLPKINGKNQHDGRRFAATEVKFESDSDKVLFSVNIKNAYENKDDINKWVRTIVFDRKNAEITVTEDYSLKKCSCIVLNFLSHKPFSLTDSGIAMIAESGTVLNMFIDTALFETEFETIELQDRLLKRSWGDKLYRAKLTVKSKDNDGIIKYTFK